MKICSHCFKDISDTAVVCPHCMKSISTPAPSVKATGAIACPNCGSTEFYAHKKGYNAGKGCLAAIFLLPFALFAAIFGLLFGALGANKIKKTCLKCNYRW